MMALCCKNGHVKARSLPHERSGRTALTFPAQGRLNGFSLASPNCQLRYSCASGILPSKVRFTWTRALRHGDSWSDSQDGCSGTGRWGATTVRRRGKKRRFSSRAGREVDHARPSHAAHSGARFKTSKLFLSGIFDVIFSDHAVDYN